jgi:hypothetical protein
VAVFRQEECEEMRTLFSFLNSSKDELVQQAKSKMDEMGLRLAPDEAGGALITFEDGTPFGKYNNVDQFVRDFVPQPTTRAYHGSTQDFDRFMTSKIGTGEGAQAYGHGMYFGEAKDTGRSYRDMLMARSGKPENMRIGDKSINEVYGEIELRADNLPAADAEMEYLKMSALEDIMIKGDVDDIIDEEMYEPIADWLKNSVAKNFKRDGRMYEVDLNMSKDQMLKWDEPISSQSQLVQERLNEIGLLDDLLLERQASLRDMYTRGLIDEPRQATVDNVTGESLYNYLAGKLDSREEASRILNNAGIRGIRYLDQNSRAGVTDPTSNFVVFDDRDVTINRKFAVSPPTMGGQGDLVGDEIVDPVLQDLSLLSEGIRANPAYNYHSALPIARSTTGRQHSLLGMDTGEYTLAVPQFVRDLGQAGIGVASQLRTGERNPAKAMGLLF